VTYSSSGEPAFAINLHPLSGISHFTTEAGVDSPDVWRDRRVCYPTRAAKQEATPGSVLRGTDNHSRTEWPSS